MNKLIRSFITILVTGAVVSCTEDLDVKNPNQPDSRAIKSEQGLISFGQGIYVTGFKDVKYYDGVPGYFWSGAIANHDLMADIVGTDIANIFINQIGCPDLITLDNGTTLPNPNSPSKQIDFIRITANVNSTGFQNSVYYEWAYMYNINNAANTILKNIPEITFTGDAATKTAVLKAWAYWWKGFAYARIGSIYYAGLIVDAANGESLEGTSGKYVSSAAIIAESNKNLDAAAAALAPLTVNADYTATMTVLIPSFNRVGKGQIPTPVMWTHSINTLKARNLLANTLVKSMTAQNWNDILTLTANGVAAADFVFTGRSNATGDFLSPTVGTVALKTLGVSGTYKITERFVQDFKGGELTTDKRFTNNIRKRTATYIGETSRGNSFFTRWELINRGTTPGDATVITWANTTAGSYDTYLASSYEENALMRAEALIYTGQIDAGLALIDAVRTSQGAGLPAVANTGLSDAQAKEELRKERRIGLAFRAVSFYDARRWGVIDPVSAGGGRKGAVALTRTGVVNTNATIEYNFLDYWDVPDNEIAYNPPADGSAPTTNPRK
ncbi:MAG TPA: RagB/SusD family nutrient uptake outer membrane protein [Cyclobacteriaceae bacterium]|nr:RagB/SusD family nutrient uptake outer membrane protein [Cyclobacteriaceae bacterium]